MIRLQNLLCLLQLTFLLSILISQTDSAAFITDPLCLSVTSDPSEKVISCQNSDERLFITEQKYSNDINGECNQSNDSIDDSPTTQCFGYNLDLSASCNGKQSCKMSTKVASFKFGFQGSNCDFQADILSVSYECIPVNFNNKSIPKYNICSNKPIDHPVHGFLHSPFYPNSYESNNFCQLRINIDTETQRLEMFLIKLELEGLSKRKHVPTDYLQINGGEVIYGNKKNMVIFNDTENAVLKFKSDTWFNYQGFYIYFKVVTKRKAIHVEITKPILESSTTYLELTTIRSMVSNLTEPQPAVINKTVDIQSEQLDDEMLFHRSFNEQRSAVSPDISVMSITNQTFFILIAIIGIMAILIIFLMFSNRQRIFKNQPQIYKDPASLTDIEYLPKTYPNNLQYSNTGFINPLIQQHGYKLNILTSNQPRTSNDSMAYLLSMNNTNGSRSSSFVDPATIIPIKTNEVYEDISMKNYAASRHYLNQLPRKESENDYSENPTITKNLLKHSAAKLNEYCYIPASMLQGCPTSYHNQKVIAEALRHNYELNENNFSSTPSVPKTLPPSLNDSSLIISFDAVTSDSDSNSYDTLTKNSKVNEYKDYKCVEAEELNDSSNADGVKQVAVGEKKAVIPEIDEYQVPLNIPA